MKREVRMQREVQTFVFWVFVNHSTLSFTRTWSGWFGSRNKNSKIKFWFDSGSARLHIPWKVKGHQVNLYISNWQACSEFLIPRLGLVEIIPGWRVCRRPRAPPIFMARGAALRSPAPFSFLSAAFHISNRHTTFCTHPTGSVNNKMARLSCSKF